jgi:hypothetical protein
MADLHERFRRTDRIPAPDLSEELWARASRREDDTVVELDRARPRGRALVAAAAAFTLLAGLVVGAALLRDADESVVATGDASWLTDSTSTMSCVEEYTPENLARRSWAFDGTIVEVVPPVDLESPDPDDQVTLVTFRVSRWYAGGPGETVTVKTSNVPGGTTINGDADPSIGARLLASGEDEYLWGCGFTMPYSDEDAAVFAAAFGG